MKPESNKIQKTKNRLINIFLLFAVCFILFSGNITSQNFTWTKVIGGPRDDISRSSIQTRDGSYIIIGEKTVLSLYNGQPLTQTYLVKLSENGSILWQKTYGDSIYSNYAYSAAEDVHGNIFIASNWNTPRLIKVDSIGNIIWERNYSWPIAEFGGIKIIDFYSKLLIHSSIFQENNITTGLVKIDTSGNLLWTKSISDTSIHSGNYNSFTVTEHNYFLVGSRHINVNNSVGSIVMMDTSFNLQWEKSFYNINTFYTIVNNNDNSFIASGNYKSTNGGGISLMFDINGSLVWEKSLLSDSVGILFSSAKTMDNNFVFSAAGINGEPKVLKLDSQGNILINKTHFYNNNDAIAYYHITNLRDSSYLLNGVIEIYNSNNIDFLVVKTDKNGNFTPIGIFNNNNLYEKDILPCVSLFPNPFNSHSKLQIKTNNNLSVTIHLYNIMGQEVALLFKGNLLNGINELILSFDKLNLSSGIYFLQIDLNSDKYSWKLTKKLCLLK